MARRAEQAARCPWCAGHLDRDASECPGCLFPLTMEAVDGKIRRGAQGHGTSSTASPASGASPARFHMHSARSSPEPVPHRARFISWLLGLTAILLVLAGITSWIAVSSPAARSDAAARFNLTVALSRAHGLDSKPGLHLDAVSGDAASDAPARPSVLAIDGAWFGAAQSTSGRCYVLGWRNDVLLSAMGGLLDRGQPCTGTQARVRLTKALDAAVPVKR